jgi:hypothetical protein
MDWRRRSAALLVALSAGLFAADGSSAQAHSPQLAGRAAHVLAQPSSGIGEACRRDYYKNALGNCVHSPSSNPVGATARCRDSTYSYSQSASGTCSHHGGVATWIRHP